MDAQQLIAEFLQSEHGAQGLQALAAQGLSEADAQQALSAAAEAARAHVESQAAPEHHGGRNFFAAFAAGLVRGDGFFKSLLEGGEGVLTGRVAESIAARTGVDPSKASAIAAAATPFVVGFLRQKLG